MSSIADKLNHDLKDAMRAKDQTRLTAIRMLKTAVKNHEVAKKNAATDQDVLGIIQKQIKQRKESIEQFEKARRQEQAGQEKAEMRVLESYLPKQMEDAVLEKLAGEVVKEHSLSSKKDFGKAMKFVQEKTHGQADNRRISQVLNKLLS